MNEQILSQLRDYPLSRALKHYSLNIRADKRDHKYSRVKSHHSQKIGHLKAALHRFYHLSHKNRRYDIVGDRKEHHEQDECKAPPMRLCVDEKTFCYLAVLHISVKADSFLLLAYRHKRDNEYNRYRAKHTAYYPKRKKLTHLPLPPLRPARHQDAAALP